MPQVANNNSVIRNTISGGEHGLAIYHSSNNRIEGNTVIDTRCGIVLGYASKNIIVNNNFSNIGWEGLDSEQNGMELFHSWDNIIANNCISLAKVFGILLSGSSQGNTLQGNVIWSCIRGIGLYRSSDDNKIVNNSVMLSKENSLILNDSRDNIIHHNNFIGNGGEAYDDALNHWDWEDKGNYWSGYRGKDTDSDGVGDTPQRIDPNGIDSRPMIEPLTLTWLRVPEQEAIPITDSQLPPGEPIAEEVVWQDKTITLDMERLVIERGGSLTLNNMTLIIPKGVEGIYVYPGGSLYIYNSKIIPAEDGGGFLFQVHKDAVLVVEASELRRCGFCPHSGDWGGLQILTAIATIENNLITDSYYGIEISQLGVSALEDTSIYIRNNIISDCHQAIRGIGMYESVQAHIENNTILNCIE